jgi:hypothetical protein
MGGEGYPVTEDSLERIASTIDGRGDLINDDTAIIGGYGD